MRRQIQVLAGLAAVLVAAAGFWLHSVAPAQAATLVQVTGFGSNPGGDQMYIYVPDTVTANPPILVALHQCTGSGPAFFASTEFASLASQDGSSSSTRR